MSLVTWAAELAASLGKPEAGKFIYDWAKASGGKPLNAAETERLTRAVEQGFNTVGYRYAANPAQDERHLQKMLLDPKRLAGENRAFHVDVTPGAPAARTRAFNVTGDPAVFEPGYAGVRPLALRLENLTRGSDDQANTTRFLTEALRRNSSGVRYTPTEGELAGPARNVDSPFYTLAKGSGSNYQPSVAMIDPTAVRDLRSAAFTPRTAAALTAAVAAGTTPLLQAKEASAMADNIRATPQNPYTGKLASALRRMQQFAGQYQVDPRVPLLGGTSVDELLSLPGTASLMEDVSYNGPRALIRGGNAATGGIGTFKLDPRILDTAEFASNVSPLAVLAGKGATRGAMAAGRAGERLAERAVPQVMDRGGVGAQLLRDLSQGSGANVIKPKGGNWLSGSVEDSLKGLRVTMGQDRAEPAERMARLVQMREADIANGAVVDEARYAETMSQLGQRSAINNWIDKQLTRYVQKDMATPEDPIRALAEQGVLHYAPQESTAGPGLRATRKEFGFPQSGMAGTSDLAQTWEAISDSSVLPYKLTEEHKIGAKAMRRPYPEQIPLGSVVYDTNDLRPRGLGFDHLIDELRNAVNPESGLPRELLLKYSSLPQVSVPQAVQRVADINAWRAAQKAEADLARANNAATVLHKEYPDQGFKWVELKKGQDIPAGWTTKADRFGNEQWINTEGKLQEVNKDPRIAALEDALKYESDTMGHCVGGYCPDVIEGKSRIYSLRDAKGQPHVTVEVKPSDWYDQIKNRSMEDSKLFNAQFKARLAEARLDPKGRGPEATNLGNSVYTELFGSAPEPTITQIKGKANRAPNPEYLPFVQDFVKSGQWSDVGDLQNTGLRRTRDVLNDLERKTLAEKGHEFGDYMTEPERQGLQQLWDQGREAGRPGFATGGLVQHSYDPAKIDALTQQLQEELNAA